jgi:PAS domain S-box-containing protein
LLKGEEKYRNIVETSNEGISLNDGKGLLTYANQKMAEMLGYDINEVIGRNILDFVVDIDDSVVTNSIQRQLQDNIQSYDFKLLRKDRSPLWVFVNIKSFFDDNGKFIGSLNMFTDITERKNAEMKLKETLDNLENLVRERTSELEKAYNSLKESEQSFTEAQKMAHIGNWEWDIATDIMYWSDELYRIFGLSPQSTTPNYKELFEYIHPEDRDYVTNIIAKNEKHISFDFRIILANGEERTVNMQTEIVYHENIPIKTKGTIQDITERKLAEEKIQVLADVVESSNDAIITKSLDGIITTWNKGAELVYGYSVEEVLGKPVSILVSPFSDEEPQVLTERIIHGEKIRYYETSRIRKNGKLINISLNLSPVFNTSGKLTAISIIARDITERKKIEEKLRESEEKYRNIVETANEGIIVTDKESIITYLNKKMADMLGYAVEESIGKPIWYFLIEESKNIVKSNMIKRQQGIDNLYEAQLVHKDGSLIWVTINAKCLIDKNGEFMGSLGMLSDITKRKEAEQVLANLEIARKQEIHHRIKNNLQIISSLLDLQSEKFRDKKNIKDSEVREAFKKSQDRVISMALIHEELHKGEGLDELNFSPYVEELTGSLFLTNRPDITEVSLNMDLEENIVFDMDIAVPLGIIVNELVSNSLKYAFPGRDNGEIKIILHREERDLISISEKSEFKGPKSTNFVLSVSDNGIGIPEDVDIENPGSLGLQLVISLVDQLDGTLELKRNNGTEFIIRFAVMEKYNKGSSPVSNIYSSSPKFLQ